MMELLRKLHAWVGAAICLAIAAIAFSGAILTYRPALQRAMTPGAQVAADLSPPSLGRVMAQAEGRFGLDRITSVTFASDEFGLHQVYLKGGGGAYLDAAGRVVEQWEARERTFDWLFELHRGLLGGATGDRVVGWLGVVLTVLTVAGLILWWPSRRSFRGRIAPGQGGRGAWLSAHRDLGLMSAPLVIALALTGAALNLPDLSRPLMHAPLPPAPPAQGGRPVDWEATVRAAQARFPQATLRMAVQPAPGKAASVRLRQPSEWHANGRTIVYLDPQGPTILQVVDAEAQGLGGRVFNSFWPIHAARVGGPLWALVVFLSGVALGLLSLYGAEAYRRKLFRRRPRRETARVSA